MGFGENEGEKVLPSGSHFCILFYRVCVCVQPAILLVLLEHTHRAGFSHHLVGCAAAVSSRDVYGAWGDAKKGDYSCHLSVNP